MKWLIDFLKGLFGSKPVLKEEAKMIKRKIYSIPKYGDVTDDVKVLKAALNDHGSKLDINNDFFGDSTLAQLQNFQKSKGLIGTGVIGEKTLELLGLELQQPANDVKPSWKKEAEKHKGKVETNPTFAALMVPLWKVLFKMKLGTISTSWAAWCGLAMAAALYWAGMDWQTDGALARNWGKYGTAIEWRTDGIPEGAIVWINGKGDCKSSSGNHVAQADGDCAPADLTKKNATINLYGGNQGNTWKVSTYAVSKICAVRWPTKPTDPEKLKKWTPPRKIVVSRRCTSGSTANESTR